MTSTARPAWARESAVLRLGDDATTVEITPEWAFGGSTGAGVRVAVIDSGIDADHPALEDSIDVDGAIDFGVGDDGTVVATTGPHGDVFGHGTACAGIIHALAPAARITSVRVLGPSLSGTAAAFHAGLVWAVEEGFDVINLSLGTAKKDWALAFHEICDRAYFGGSFVVTAANNVQRISYPSLFASVASVACNTATDPLRFHANPEPPTEFLARGIAVEVPWLDGGTTTTTGNSFAAPHIAAFAALVKSKHPDLRPFQIKAALWATAANVREATAPDAAGRRGTMFQSAARGTAMALVRPATAAAPATGPGDRAEPGPDATARRRRTAAPALRPPVVDGFEIGEVVGHWRWGAVRRGRRVDGGEAVEVRELGGAGALVDGVRAAGERAADLASAGLARPLAVIADPPVLITPAPLPVDDLDADGRTAVAMAATSALAAAHRADLVHGDVEVGWLWRTGATGVTLGGLGIATALGPPPQAAAAALHPSALAHLAPEQFGDHEPSPAIDVFSLGLLWCRILAGGSPWPAVEGLGSFLRQRLSTPAGPVADLGEAIAPGLAAVLDQALHLDPDDRPPDAGALLASIEAVLPPQ